MWVGKERLDGAHGRFNISGVVRRNGVDIWDVEAVQGEGKREREKRAVTQY